ncbi:MAG: hypothetical protein SGI92_12055 [Bryobacteraceae bacterium]|nr:hypothetical protein [Bryobacteraceae bacterium]
MDSTQPQTLVSRIAWGFLAVGAGITVLLFNFHGLLRHTATHRLNPQSSFASGLISISLLPKSILSAINPIDTELLYSAMRSCFVGLSCFIGLLLILGLVRRDVKIPTLGLTTFGLGACLLAVTTWTLWILWVIIAGIFSAVGWIFQLIQGCLVWLLQALLFLGPYIGFIVFVIAIIALWKWLGPKNLILVVAAVGLIYLLFPFLQKAWLFLYNTIFLPVLNFFGLVLGWLLMAVLALASVIFGVCLAVGIVGSLGYLLIDQLRTAWCCGGTKKGIIMGSSSLGVALSLIMLVALGKELSTTQKLTDVTPAKTEVQSSAKKIPSTKKGKRAAAKTRTTQNAVLPVRIPEPPKETPAQAIDRAWRSQAFLAKDGSPSRLFTAALPSGVQHWAQDTFQSASAPAFDALVLALAVLLSLLSTVRGMFQWEQFEPKVKFYSTDFIGLAALPLLLVVLAVGASEDNS